jgi:hypothetical protein
MIIVVPLKVEIHVLSIKVADGVLIIIVSHVTSSRWKSIAILLWDAYIAIIFAHLMIFAEFLIPRSFANKICTVDGLQPFHFVEAANFSQKKKNVKKTEDVSLKKHV